MDKRALVACILALTLIARATGQDPAIELPTSTTAAVHEEPAILDILVSKDGERRVRGEVVDLDHLKLAALEWAERKRDLEHPARVSEMAVLISADRRVRWREIQWTLQALADPAVRIYRIYLAAESADEPRMLPVFLPRDRGVTRRRFDERVVIPVELKRTSEEKHTRVKLLDSMVGVDEEGFRALDRRIAQIHSVDATIPGEIHGWAAVTLEDVVRAIDAFRKAGIEEITFIGAPPPGRAEPAPEPAPPMIEDEEPGDGIALGLTWLKRHQDEQGYWDCDGFSACCGDEICDGPGEAVFDPGVTGLALLAFLEAGNTHRRGPHRKTVREALKYLAQIQDAEGCFGPRTPQRFIYSHAIATLAMVRAYALTRSPLFKQKAQFAVDFLQQAQNPGMAWRYGVRPEDNDTSVTAWAVSALCAAKAAGLRVSEGSFRGARNWLDTATDPETGRVGYASRGTGPTRPKDRLEAFPADRSESLTAAGILCRLLLGDKPSASPPVSSGSKLCFACPPTWDERGGGIDMYYWYYGARAMRRLDGEEPDRWSDTLREVLTSHQRKDGHEAGSWDPAGVWGREGGRVYATAISVLSLEACRR